MNTPYSHATDDHNAPVAPHASAGSNTILLVEDDTSVRRFFEVTLQRAGFTVVAVSDGLQAMKQFLAQRFDAVVTDAVLPYVSGGEICRFLRGHPQFAATPVILLSGFSPSAGAVAEANAYLAKPVRPDELIECLRRLIPAA